MSIKNRKNKIYNNETFSVAYREQLNLFWKKVDFLSIFLGDPVNKKIVETPPTFINKTKKILPKKIWCCVGTVSHTNEQKK